MLTWGKPGLGAVACAGGASTRAQPGCADALDGIVDDGGVGGAVTDCHSDLEVESPAETEEAETLLQDAGGGWVGASAGEADTGVQLASGAAGVVVSGDATG